MMHGCSHVIWLSVIILQRIITNSTVPLSSTEIFSAAFSSLFFCVAANYFAASVQPRRPRQRCFLLQQAAFLSEKARKNSAADRLRDSLVKNNGVFSSLSATYFPQEFVESNTELKGESILDLDSLDGHKHEC